MNKVCVRPLPVWIGTSTTCCPFESSTTLPSNSATSTWWSPRRQTEVPAKRTDRVIYYDALVAARGNLSRATHVWVVPSDSLDRYVVCVCVCVCQCVSVSVCAHARIQVGMLEVFTIEPGELLPKATGVRLVELGLSYVLPDSAVPPCYRQAWLQSSDGVHAPSLAECDALAPWQIKNVLLQPDDETTEQWAHGSLQVSCSVRNKVDHLNEANLLILKSRIPGAGSGLFLRPTPLPPGNQLCTPDGKHICLYSRRPLPSEVAAESLPTTD